MKSLVLSLSISLALALVTTVEAQNPQLIFEKDIKPILLTYCYECHNAELQEGKVRLDNLNPDLVALIFHTTSVLQEVQHERFNSTLAMRRSPG